MTKRIWPVRCPTYPPFIPWPGPFWPGAFWAGTLTGSWFNIFAMSWIGCENNAQARYGEFSAKRRLAQTPRPTRVVFFLKLELQRMQTKYFQAKIQIQRQPHPSRSWLFAGTLESNISEMKSPIDMTTNKKSWFLSAYIKMVF